MIHIIQFKRREFTEYKNRDLKESILINAIRIVSGNSPKII